MLVLPLLRCMLIKQPRTALMEYVMLSAALTYQLCAHMHGIGVQGTVINDYREAAQ